MIDVAINWDTNNLINNKLKIHLILSKLNIKKDFKSFFYIKN